MGRGGPLQFDRHGSRSRPPALSASTLPKRRVIRAVRSFAVGAVWPSIYAAPCLVFNRIAIAVICFRVYSETFRNRSTAILRAMIGSCSPLFYFSRKFSGMNTCEIVSKHTTLTGCRMNTYGSRRCDVAGLACVPWDFRSRDLISPYLALAPILKTSPQAWPGPGKLTS